CSRSIHFAPNRNTQIIANYCVDRIEKSRMHFQEIDGPQIGNPWLAPARKPRLGFGKAEAAVDHTDFLALRRVQIGHRGYRERCGGRAHETPGVRYHVTPAPSDRD